MSDLVTIHAIPHIRFLNGMGTGLRPPNYDYVYLDKLIDKQQYVTATQAIQAALDVARCEGILSGGSGGAVFVMKHMVPKAYGKGQNVVAILPDHGSRYVDSSSHEEWLRLRELDVDL